MERAQTDKGSGLKIIFILSFFIALILGLVFTPIVIVIALKFNIVDIPNTEVKTHKKVTPYLGGGAIALSLLVTLFILTITFNLNVDKKIYGILVSCLIIIILGLIDDVKNITPFRKISFQFLAAIIVVLSGTKIYLTNIEMIDVILTILWIIALTNALNLIDIMDGLAAGIATIASLSLSILSLQMDELFLCAVLLALAGSCLGFLKYNFNPAQIFMGDTGSLFLGFLLACISINFIDVGEVIQSTFILFFVFGIPIFETIFVSILRIKSKRSPLIGSKDHFALRMVNSGLTVKKTVLVTYSTGILLGVVSITSFNFKDLTPFFIIVILIAVIIVAKKLGRIDMSNF